MTACVGCAPAPSLLNGNEWLFLWVLAAVGIVAFFEEGPGWLILKWLGRIVIGLGVVALGVVAWNLAAGIPVSVAIILGAVIITLGVRSFLRRLMAVPAEPPRPRHSD